MHTWNELLVPASVTVEQVSPAPHPRPAVALSQKGTHLPELSPPCARTPDAGAPELTFRITGDVPDGGGTVELPITPGTRTEVPQVQAIHVATNVGLHNYRIRLFDEADRAMVSDDTADDGAQGTRYDIVLAGPLKTGFKYSLVVEAETGPMFEDVTGRDHPDLRVDWIVAGEKEKPPPPPKRPSRRRRH